MTETVSYKIATEISASYMEKLFDFIYKQYLPTQKQRFMNFYRETIDGVAFLSYAILDAQGKPLLKAEVKGTTPIEMTLTPLAASVHAIAIEEAKQDLVIAVQLFEEHVSKTTLYFAWREGESIVPETLGKQENSFHRLFLETQIFFLLRSLLLVC